MREHGPRKHRSNSPKKKKTTSAATSSGIGRKVILFRRSRSAATTNASTPSAPPAPSSNPQPITAQQTSPTRTHGKSHKPSKMRLISSPVKSAPTSPTKSKGKVVVTRGRSLLRATGRSIKGKTKASSASALNKLNGATSGGKSSTTTPSRSSGFVNLSFDVGNVLESELIRLEFFRYRHIL